MQADKAKAVEAAITEYHDAEKELVDMFNRLSEEKQQQFIEYLNQLVADRAEK